MSTDPHEQFAKRWNRDQGCPVCGGYTNYAPLRSKHNLFYMECKDHGWRWLCIPSWLHGYDPEVPVTAWHDPGYFKRQKANDAAHAHKRLTMEEWAQAEAERRRAAETLWKPGVPAKKKSALTRLG